MKETIGAVHAHAIDNPPIYCTCVNEALRYILCV